MKTVTLELLTSLSKKAKKSHRKRTHYLFHEYKDPVQRMVNALEPGSYIRPHKHQNPDKIEAFIILRGKAACLQFNDVGEIIEVHILSEKGPKLAVDIPPRTWHTFVSLRPGTCLFEVIQGPYKKETHKNTASWSPEEDKGDNYLKKLEKEIKNWERK
jgi:cupin fold WbuC family metalloprotein